MADPLMLRAKFIFTLRLISAAGAILLGLLYIWGAFGPTEAEVATWGQVCLYSGIILLGLTLGWGRSDRGWGAGLLSLGYGLLALLQVLPIYLWFQFHGLGISDGTPPSHFVAHWAYALPHLALLLAGLGIISGHFHHHLGRSNYAG